MAGWGCVLVTKDSLSPLDEEGRELSPAAVVPGLAQGGLANRTDWCGRSPSVGACSVITRVTGPGWPGPPEVWVFTRVGQEVWVKLPLRDAAAYAVPTAQTRGTDGTAASRDSSFP